MNKKEQQMYQAQDDAYTMARYQEIMADKGRARRAVKAAQSQAKNMEAQAKAMTPRSVARHTPFQATLLVKIPLRLQRNADKKMKIGPDFLLFKIPSFRFLGIEFIKSPRAADRHKLHRSAYRPVRASPDAVPHGSVRLCARYV